jgi:hypothetical protein
MSDKKETKISGRKRKREIEDHDGEDRHNKKTKTLTGVITKKTRTQKSRRKDPNAPRGALTAYWIFMVKRRRELQADKQYKIKNKNGDIVNNSRLISKVVNEEWNSLTDEQKKPYVEKSKKDKIRYENEMKIYKKNNPGKKIMNFVPCENISEVNANLVLSVFQTLSNRTEVVKIRNGLNSILKGLVKENTVTGSSTNSKKKPLGRIRKAPRKVRLKKKKKKVKIYVDSDSDMDLDEDSIKEIDSSDSEMEEVIVRRPKKKATRKKKKKKNVTKKRKDTKKKRKKVTKAKAKKKSKPKVVEVSDLDIDIDEDLDNDDLDDDLDEVVNPKKMEKLKKKPKAKKKSKKEEIVTVEDNTEMDDNMEIYDTTEFIKVSPNDKIEVENVIEVVEDVNNFEF